MAKTRARGRGAWAWAAAAAGADRPPRRRRLLRPSPLDLLAALLLTAPRSCRASGAKVDPEPTLISNYGPPSAGCKTNEDDISLHTDDNNTASVCAWRVPFDKGGKPNCTTGGIEPNPRNGCPALAFEEHQDPDVQTNTTAWPICLQLHPPGNTNNHCFLACSKSDVCPNGAVCSYSAYLFNIGLCTFPTGGAASDSSSAAAAMAACGGAARGGAAAAAAPAAPAEAAALGAAAYRARSPVHV